MARPEIAPRRELRQLERGVAERRRLQTATAGGQVRKEERSGIDLLEAMSPRITHRERL
jgi:hypothetical protein